MSTANNWAVSSNNDGFRLQDPYVAVNALYDQLTLSGGALVSGASHYSTVDVTTTAPASGLFSFDYTLDIGTPQASHAYYIINGTHFPLAGGAGSVRDVYLNAGDSFGFGVNIGPQSTLNKIQAKAVLNVAKFSAPLPRSLTYTLRDLGSLDRYRIPLDTTTSRGYAIDNAGNVAGESGLQGTLILSEAFYTSYDTMYPLMLSGRTAAAYAINETGGVAGRGEVHYLPHVSTVSHAFLNGLDLTDLTPFYNYPSDGRESVARGVNASGHVTGTVGGRAFLWTHQYQTYPKEGLVDLGTPIGSTSVGNGINDKDQITGSMSLVSGQEHAFLYDAGVIKDLGTLGGANSVGNAINARGEIVGDSDDASGHKRAFLYRDGQMTALGAPLGSLSSAVGMNSTGQIVGWYAPAPTPEDPYPARHFVLHDRFAITDLTAMFPDLVDVAGINDALQIVGTARVPVSICYSANYCETATATHAVVLDPILPAAHAGVTHISARALAGASGPDLVTRFNVPGPGRMTTVIRGLGPSLESRVHGAFVAGPVIELRGPDGSLIARNDDWQDLGTWKRFAPKNSKESALVADLGVGSYTVQLINKESSAGIGLLEVYGLEKGPSSGFPAVSTRGWVGLGEEALIAGVTIGPKGSPSAAKCLVRALGPSLAAHGVVNVLADPVLSIFDQNGTLIGWNDDWQQNTSSVTLPPHDRREAAVQGFAQPGRYTAVVRGKNGGTGNASLEICDLD